MATELAITDEDHKVSALPGGAPLRDLPDAWSVKVALRVDMLMLEQVEALEDRVANASMQIKVLINHIPRRHSIYILCFFLGLESSSSSLDRREC